MIPLTNHDFQWGRSEVVIIYPDINMQNAKQQYYPEIYIYVYIYMPLVIPSGY